jgi:glucose uptake protein GlcU
MWNIIKQIFLFRMAQNSTRGVARMVGLGRLGVLLGIIGGIRAVRRQRHA